MIRQWTSRDTCIVNTSFPHQTTQCVWKSQCASTKKRYLKENWFRSCGILKKTWYKRSHISLMIGWLMFMLIEILIHLNTNPVCHKCIILLNITRLLSALCFVTFPGFPSIITFTTCISYVSDIAKVWYTLTWWWPFDIAMIYHHGRVSDLLYYWKSYKTVLYEICWITLFHIL